ncbi:hypothetical protein HQ585_08445 [candidate division KSB1 bacterium]|nr:hypothetical protein [candidate division KSB1 bacterium]
MKRYILLFIIIFVSILSAKEIEESETIEKTFTIEKPSKDFLIVVDNVFGSIKVNGTKGKSVTSTIQKTVWARSEEQFEKAQEEVSLDIIQETDMIELYVDGPFRDREDKRSSYNEKRYTVTYDFEIEVPRDVSIEVRTVNGSDITVHDIRGDYDVHNVNGGIEMAGIAGSGDAITVNGPVSCQFDENPEDDCEFRSINGDIRIYFQDPLSVDVTFKTMNGEMYSDFEVSHVPESQFTKTKKHGKTMYKAERPMKVRAGNGGALIAASGINGDLFVLKNR